MYHLLSSLRACLIALVAVTSLAGGCVVHSTATTGILEVRWANDVSACSGLSGVRIRIERAGQIYDQSPLVACSKGFHSFALEAGTYDVFVQGVSNSNQVVRGASLSGLQVEVDVNTLSPVLTMGTVSASGGTLRLKWQVAGMSAANGCAQLGLKTVTASVFNSTFSKVLAQEEATCSTGELEIGGIAAGQVWLQLDGRDAAEHAFWGNLKAYGPLDIVEGGTATLGEVLDVIDLRASINIPWQFANGKTCGGNGVTTVKLEISRADGTVLVPMSAADATKPCDIGAKTAMAQRAIDLQFASPTCTIPPGADGLILCGILEQNLDVRAVSIDEKTGTVSYGGWLKIRDLHLGTYTPNTKPLYLESCNAAGVDCSAN